MKVNGERIHCVRFADDILVIEDSEKETNKMLLVLVGTLKLICKWKCIRRELR